MTIPAVSRLDPPRNSGPTLNVSLSPNGVPVLDEAALHGLVGDVVKTIGPHSEAARPALLLNCLVALGNAAGSSAHVRIGPRPHPGRLFGVVVGNSSRARKGTAWSEIDRLFRLADPEWWLKRKEGGLSSGEGLIKRASTLDGDNRRLMVVEEEFSRVLKVAGREGNILSETLRQAYDVGPMSVMTKEALRAPDTHISIAGMITQRELRDRITGTEIANGLANRFLWVYAEKAQLLSRGGNLGDEELQPLADEMKQRIDAAHSRVNVPFSAAGGALWDDLYLQLDQDTPGGIVEDLIARNQTHVLRLSLIYALAEASRFIEPEHIEAAVAFWRYCRDSVELIFGDRIGDPYADKICRVMQEANEMSRTELSRALGGRVNPDVLTRALALVEARGWIEQVAAPRGEGRRATMILWVRP